MAHTADYVAIGRDKRASGVSEDDLVAAASKPVPSAVGELHDWNPWTGVTCVECPRCAFAFDACHTDLDGASYSCPLCAQIDGTRGAT